MGPLHNGSVSPRCGYAAHPGVAPLDLLGAVAQRQAHDAEVVTPLTDEGTHGERLGHKAVLDQDREVAWWDPLNSEEEE